MSLHHTAFKFDRNAGWCQAQCGKAGKVLSGLIFAGQETNCCEHCYGANPVSQLQSSALWRAFPERMGSQMENSWLFCPWFCLALWLSTVLRARVGRYKERAHKVWLWLIFLSTLYTSQQQNQTGFLYQIKNLQKKRKIIVQRKTPQKQPSCLSQGPMIISTPPQESPKGHLPPYDRRKLWAESRCFHQS